MSDFTHLTEFDDFHKDLFLSNAMEAIAEGDLLEELDCKDDLKLMSDVTEAFNASLKRRNDDDMESLKARDSPFTLFIDEDHTAGSLQFMNSTTSQLQAPRVSDDMDIKEMGLTHTINNSSGGSTIHEGLPSHSTALLAANELNCMSLDDLDLAPVNSTNAMCKLLSPLQQVVSFATSGDAAPPPPIASLSPLRKDTLTYKREAQSVDMVTSPTEIRKPSASSLPSTAAFSRSDGDSLLNMVLRAGEGCGIPQVKSTLAQSVSVSTREDNSTMHATAFGSLNMSIQGHVTHVPSLQRSQSSHALGQLRISNCLRVRADDVRTKPLCKQEIMPLSRASSMSIFTPYQSPNTQCLSQTSAPIRRVYSTGDLQGFNGMQSFYGIKAENVIPEEATGIKIGHYTMEERKMKLHRYRQKRTERNFSKKIKYACRKTLADNRPRVRGRFARSDEMGDSGLKGSELPLIDEYEEAVASHYRARVVRDQQAYYMANNSCIMSSTPIAQFWNTVGMKVAM
ncbi:hypothetical protein GOP47_0028432 [Adiantum capillus-veneris]|nr:hypothetical protein GOP47_0028432 [Adiantum capillus-veneris]